MAGKARPDVPQIRRVAMSSAFGGIIEYYDFFIFGLAAALVFPELFFAAVDDPTIATLLSFLTFAVGFISRPLGSILFGHLGDRYGRKVNLQVTLMLMGLSTTAIGLLPTYSAIGVAAPVMLLALRFLQGVAFGGELAGAGLLTVEHAPADRRGFWGTFAYFGSPVGQALATLVLLIATVVVDEGTFLAWGWRIPFLVSLVIVLVGLYLRHSVEDSPVSVAMRKNGQTVGLPLLSILKEEWPQLLRNVGLHLGITVTFYTNSVFISSYLTQEVGVGQVTVLIPMLVANVLLLPVQIAAGAASDRYGRRLVYLFGAAWMVLTPFPYFLLIDTASPALITVAMVLFGSAVYIMNGPQPAYFAELFDARRRYTGYAVSLSIATILGGAAAPTVATVLTAQLDGRPWGVALYAMGIGLVVAVCAAFSPETRGVNLFEVSQERESQRSVVGSAGARGER